ncbi:hypothetical protein [Cellulomonas bogoriensis]|uniref:Uncharacterized protein n=1 Tax=Cellulomonas bogoriensis 69B4 = DSM 16987 TaxID=1386082 RepID=A0A0A0C3E5_9CELL|nr:hypothetical protein [Cellulomonas bogoriensis]KGM13884.1 hypothetical protein N869_08405 [Cellulomonas bogoriensis 69B4 = DSM 16987]
MSTHPVTLDRPTPRPRAAHLHTARHMVRGHLRLIGWFAVIALVVITVAILTRFAFGQPQESMAQFGRQALVWFPFSIAIGAVSSYLPVHVASGMTRRSYTAGVLLGTAVLTAGFAAGAAVVLLLERGVYQVAGWSHGISEWDPLYRSVTQVHLVLADHVALTGTAMVAGLLVGTTYYRYGPWVGTLSLPLTVGPLVVVLWVLPYLGAEHGWTVTQHLLATAAIIAALAGVFAVLIRDITVSTRS